LPNGANGEDRGDGRTKRGRFARGNKAAIGHANPHARQVARVRAALVASLTDEKIERLVDALLSMVEIDKNLAAAEYLVRITAGPPLKYVIDPDHVDARELEQLRSELDPDELPCDQLGTQAALILERARAARRAAEHLAVEQYDEDLRPFIERELSRPGLEALAAAARRSREEHLANDAKFRAKEEAAKFENLGGAGI
jgi:hypothetical protein